MNRRERLRADFQRQYGSLRLPHSFASQNAVVAAYRGVRNAKDVVSDLHALESYSLHKQTRKVGTFNPIYVNRRRQLLQMDLVDVQRLANANDRIRFLLTVIDTFSRRAYIRPLADKTTAATLAAFLDILREMGPPLPDRIMHDSGLEFLGGAFTQAMRDLGIRVTIPRYKSPHVERFQRSLKNVMFRYMTEFKTNRYIDVLAYILWVLNNRKHRIIDMAPNEADREGNRAAVLAELEEFYDRSSKVTGKLPKPKLKVGDIVRVMREKDAFARGFKPQFHDAFFRVETVNLRLPIPMYKIRNVATGQPVRRSFYGGELNLFTGENIRVTPTGRVRVLNGVHQTEVTLQGYPGRRFVDTHKVLDWLGR